MKKKILATLISSILVGCGGGGGEEAIAVRVDQPQNATTPATTSSDLTSGKHIPTLTNPNPAPTGSIPPTTVTVKIPVQSQKAEEPAPKLSVPTAEPEPTKVAQKPPAQPVAQAPGNPPAQNIPVAVQRVTSDRPDEVAGHQVHVIYAVPKDGVDRSRDTSKQLYDTLIAMDKWMSNETQGRRFKFDTVGGRHDVSYVDLIKTDEEYRSHEVMMRDAIEADLRSLGFVSDNKVYLVYYEGTHPTSCGDSSNPSFNHGYNVAVLYMQNNCHVRTDYTVLASIHELLHAFGAMSPSAPLHTTLGHTDHPDDIMYDKYLDPSRPRRLDPYGINYYNPNGLPNGLWNLAQSPYLTEVVQ